MIILDDKRIHPPPQYTHRPLCAKPSSVSHSWKSWIPDSRPWSSYGPTWMLTKTGANKTHSGASAWQAVAKKAFSSKLGGFTYGWAGRLATCLLATQALHLISIQWPEVLFIFYYVVGDILLFKKLRKKCDSSIWGLCQPLHLFFFFALDNPVYFSKGVS